MILGAFIADGCKYTDEWTDGKQVTCTAEELKPYLFGIAQVYLLDGDDLSSLHQCTSAFRMP